MVKISVIIPIYNSEKYLEHCLASVINQTYRDMEIILVDDGSTDFSLEICLKYAEQDKRILVIQQAHRGVTNARKAGIKVAKAEYIAFVDSDDWVEPCFFERLYGLAEKYQADMVASGCMVEQGSESFAKVNQFEEGDYDKKVLKEKIYPAMLYYESNAIFCFGILQYLWNKLFKRTVIEPCIQNLDERIYDGEDVACVFDACLKSSSIVIDNHPYYHYRIHADSICTSVRDERYLVNAVYLYQYMEEIFRNAGEYQMMEPQLKRFMAFFINNGTETIFGYRYQKEYSYFIWTLPKLPRVEHCEIAVFGAGNVGQSYCRQLLQMGNIEIALLVDNYTHGNKIEGMDIEKPETLLVSRWDYVLVAVIKEKQAEEIINWMKEQGISEEKILYEEPELKYPLYQLQLN